MKTALPTALVAGESRLLVRAPLGGESLDAVIFCVLTNINTPWAVSIPAVVVRLASDPGHELVLDPRVPVVVG